MTVKKKVQRLKRDLILEEATKLFIADGYENMKIAELATNVGVSVGSIYTLFESKENLYNSYLMSQLEYYRNILEKEVAKYSDPIDKLKALAHIKLGAYVTNKNALREVLIKDPLFFINVSAEHDDPIMKIYTFIMENIMTPLAMTVNTKKTAIDMTFLFDGLGIGMIKHWIIAGGDLVARTDELVDNFLKIIEEK